MRILRYPSLCLVIYFLACLETFTLRKRARVQYINESRYIDLECRAECNRGRAIIITVIQQSKGWIERGEMGKQLFFLYSLTCTND